MHIIINNFVFSHVHFVLYIMLSFGLCMFLLCCRIKILSFVHLGHTISVTCDDRSEIMKKRSMLCGQINSVLCFFSKRDPIIKLSLLKSYCSSFYGCVLWDLSHSCINDFCVIWRKGLRRVWDLPHNTHSNLLSPLCGSLPLMDEISCRNAQFIGNCLKSDCEIVNFIARHGVYFSRMLSPIGRNAQFCSSRFSISLNDIGTVTKN